MTRLVLLLIVMCAHGAIAATSDMPIPTVVKRAVVSCRLHATVDVCYDAIRWMPGDPTLLVALGDALSRAKRPADAIRSYRRAAALAPSLKGLSAKISVAEARLAAERTRPKARLPSAGPSQPLALPNDFSNTDPITATH